MTWRIKSFTFMPIFFFLLLSCMLFSFLFIDNASAVSDITYTFNIDSIPTWYDICSGSCSDFSYMLVEPSSPGSCNNVSYFFVNGIISSNVPVPSCSSSLFFLSSPSNIYLTGGKAGSYSGDITITLSDSFGSFPSGDLSITSNGQYDVSNYATAIVNVPADVVPGDYHDDLIDIKHSIYVCAGVLLVLYFFYCIYRLIIKSTGGQ